MQESKRNILLNALSKTVKELRKDKSQFMLGAEYDIPSSVISNIERGVKDPQFTTLFRLSEAFGLKLSEFAKEIEKELPENFSVTGN